MVAKSVASQCSHIFYCSVAQSCCEVAQRFPWPKTIQEQKRSLLAQAVKSSGTIRKLMAPPVNGCGARENTKIMVRRPVQFCGNGRCVDSLAAQAKELDKPLERHVIGCKANVV